jgi:glycosyltransferase involved in cell wall biosynthesis
VSGTPEKLRVLVLFESTIISGPAKNLLEFASLARQQAPRIEVEVAVFWRPNDSPVFVDSAGKTGILVHRIPEKARFDFSVIPSLRDLIRTRQPDIIQSHAVKGHFLVRYSGLHKLLPWVAFNHGYTATDLRTRAYNTLDLWSLRAPRSLVLVNQIFADRLIRQGIPRERVHVIHNAIRADWAQQARQPENAGPLRAMLGIPPDRKIILTAGRLSREKDYGTLIQALALARDRYSLQPHLIIAGEGPERAHLQAEIARLNLAQQITMTGWIPSAEPYYGLADIVAISSLTEGSPNVLLEAIGAGAAVVATRVGGIPEIVTDQDSALLVPPRDPAAIAGALAKVLSSDQLAARLGAKARLVALQSYSPEVRARRIKNVYLKTLGHRELDEPASR